MDLRKQAEILAAQLYSVFYILDETTEGRPIYIALSPELEGCVAQGESVEQAIANLREARMDFIESLLEDGLSVPGPRSYPTITTSSSTANYTNISSIGVKSPGLMLVREAPGTYLINRIVSA